MIQKVHFLLHYVVEILSSSCVLHNDENHPRSFEYFVHLGDCRVSHDLEEVKLSGYALNIRNVFDSLLLQELNSDGFTCKFMDGSFYFTKSSSSNGFAIIRQEFTLLCSHSARRNFSLFAF